MSDLEFFFFGACVLADEIKGNEGIANPLSLPRLFLESVLMAHPKHRLLFPRRKMEHTHQIEPAITAAKGTHFLFLSFIRNNEQ